MVRQLAKTRFEALHQQSREGKGSRVFRTWQRGRLKIHKGWTPRRKIAQEATSTHNYRAIMRDDGVKWRKENVNCQEKLGWALSEGRWVSHSLHRVWRPFISPRAGSKWARNYLKAILFLLPKSRWGYLMTHTRPLIFNFIILFSLLN